MTCAQFIENKKNNIKYYANIMGGGVQMVNHINNIHDIQDIQI